MSETDAGSPEPLQSDTMLMSSKFSFSGSLRRLWPKLVPARFHGWAKAGLVALGVLAMLVVWVGVLLWYIIALGLFGVLFFPFRLLTRSHRKNRIEQVRHHELLQAMQEHKDQDSNRLAS